MSNVPLRITVSEDFRDRLKGYAARTGKTVGEVLETLASEPLRSLELQLIKQKETVKPDKPSAKSKE
jgi:hypothetical protein